MQCKLGRSVNTAARQLDGPQGLGAVDLPKRRP